MHRSLTRFSIVLIATAGALLPATPARADDDPSKLTLNRAVFKPSTAKPGETITLEVVVTPEEGWHIYGAGEEIGLVPSLSLDKKTFGRHLNRNASLHVPKGSPHESFGTTSYWLEGEQTLTQRFTVREDAPTGDFTLSAALHYMVCDPTMCMPPDEFDLSATLTIQEGLVRAQEKTARPSPVAPDHHVIIDNDYDEAVRIAKEHDLTLLVSFTGYTCVNCRQMELGWFRRGVISETLADGFVEARLHTDGITNIDRITELQKRLLGNVAIPSYVIVDADAGKKVGRYRDGACLNEDDAKRFAKFLDQGKKAAAKAKVAKKNGP